MKKTNYSKFLSLFAVAAFLFIAGCSSTQHMQRGQASVQGNESWLNLDTVKAGKYDTGKMWTFDYPPKAYFEKEYNFDPSDKWLDNVRMSALRFANYCSASFVSADGLVMTNHHCGRESVAEVTKKGEDLFDNGFYAKTLADERPVPGLYVDQLVMIKDITSDIQSAIDSGKTPEEKIANEKKAISEIEKKEGDATKLRMQVVKLFNGGKYSLYGYKRYTDVRLVFSPEASLGYFGGDNDNFTYPRYDLDCNFFRVYENGKPLKTEHYFHWSPQGAEPGEPVFVVGNPGHTDRLKTVSQLEYMRDIQYPRTLDLLDELINVYSKVIEEHPERKAELQNRLFGFSNSQKAYTGMLKGLRDPILMQKKIDFEKNFKDAVDAKPDLEAKYGDLWNKIATTQNELRKVSNKSFALNLNPFLSSKYFIFAEQAVKLANELKLPEAQRSEQYKGAELDSTINEIIPADFDKAMDREMLKNQIDRMIRYLGTSDVNVKEMTAGRRGYEAVDYMLGNSILTSPSKFQDVAKQGADAILNSSDPFIYFVVHSKDTRDELDKKVKSITSDETTYSQELGKALFDVYGTSIPPDATFTLRISDGVVKGYPYNGTIAPPFTTFYGLYNRYYSFDKKFPYELPKEWQNPPADFKLETPMDFVSTNDIIGGNSGSPVINEKAQIVGLAFDGNIESLPGNFIFTTETNRTVAVHSAGMLEAIKDLYKATRLSDELKTGKIVEEKTDNN
ncbi:MAG TPA: S46 family peptidase [Ignavibacteriaceae bacterium]|nr:S46 family peptidase [Ignavibacteriaceae bacterium]